MYAAFLHVDENRTIFEMEFKVYQKYKKNEHRRFLIRFTRGSILTLERS